MSPLPREQRRALLCRTPQNGSARQILWVMRKMLVTGTAARHYFDRCPHDLQGQASRDTIAAIGTVRAMIALCSDLGGTVFGCSHTGKRVNLGMSVHNSSCDVVMYVGDWRLTRPPSFSPRLRVQHFPTESLTPRTAPSAIDERLEVLHCS